MECWCWKEKEILDHGVAEVLFVDLPPTECIGGVLCALFTGEGTHCTLVLTVPEKMFTVHWRRCSSGDNASTLVLTAPEKMLTVHWRRCSLPDCSRDNASTLVLTALW